ncbi:hypothetical protein MRX96_039042 [Rhipicephalus microplus]
MEFRRMAAIVETLHGHLMVIRKATDGDHHRWQVGISWEQGKETVRDTTVLKQMSSKSLVLMHRIQKLRGAMVDRPNSDDAGPNVRAAVGDSVVCAAFPMHDASVVQLLEVPTLNYTLGSRRWWVHIYTHICCFVAPDELLDVVE